MRSRTLALGALVALALTAQTPGPATVPAPALPEIGRVHSKGLCTTVRDSVAPMVLGLMKSDELVGAGHRAFLKMANDTRTDPSPTKAGLALQMDQLYLRKAVDAMAHNLVIIDKLLADEKQFPKNAATDDDRIAQLLKTQIAAVAAQQRKTLDVMNGALETEALGRMQNDFGGGSTVTSATAGTNAPKGSLTSAERGPDPSGSFVGVAGLSMPQNGSTTIDPRTLSVSKTAGHGVWDSLARTVEVQQGAIAGAEQRLTPTVVAISIACRAELSSPAPQPSP
jgi:hypothetical protein